jgi:hypothetical protein
MSTLSLALRHNRAEFRRDTEDRIGEILRSSVDWMVSDVESAAAEVRQYQTVEQWRRHLETRISVAAFGTAAIPGIHGAGLLVELPYLFRLMGYGAIGIGELAGVKTEAEADLLAIFGLWSGAIDKRVLAAAAGAYVDLNIAAYSPFGAKVLALGLDMGVHAVAASVGGPAGVAMANGGGLAVDLLHPLLAKISAKVSAKITAKVSAKALAGFVPLVGPVVSVGISLYILKEFLDAAKRYYEHKVKAGGMP